MGKERREQEERSSMNKKARMYLFFFLLLVFTTSVTALDINVQDDFNRGDSGTVGGPWLETDPQSKLSIASNKLAWDSSGSVDSRIENTTSNIVGNHTISYVYETTDAGTSNSGNVKLIMWQDAGSNIQVACDEDKWRLDGVAFTDCNDNTPYNLSILHDPLNDVVNISINGSSHLNGSSVALVTYINKIWFDPGSNAAVTGTIDDIIWFNGSFGPTIVPQEIVLGSPINDSFSSNLTQVFEYNFISTLADVDAVELWTNSSGTWAMNLTNLTYVNSTVSNFVLTLPPGIFQWGVFANSTLGNVSWSENRTLTIDTSDPLLVDDFVNNSIYFNKNITAQFNFSDNTLVHSVNISIDGITLFSNESINLPTFQYVLDVDSSAYAVGKHNISVRAADGHTDEILKDVDSWNVDRGIFKDKLEYNIRGEYDSVDLLLESKTKSWRDEWSSIERVDRFSEVFIPSTVSTTQTFIFSANKKVQIVPKGLTDKYGGTWVIVGDHWKDFKLKDEPNAAIEILRLDDYSVEVTINNIKNTERLEFESTGDLNIINKVYDFYVGSVNETFEAVVFGGFQSDYLATVSLGNLTFDAGSPTGILEINETTNYSASLVNYSNETVLFARNITFPLFGSSGNLTHKWYLDFNSSSLVTNLTNQSFLDVEMGLCEGSKVYPVVNYTYYGEVSGSRINATHVYALNASDGTHYYPLGGAFSLNDTNSFCSNVDPSQNTYGFNVWGTNTIGADDYVTRVISTEESLPLTFSNNPIENISYYLINVTGSNTITYNWLTTNLQPVDGTMRIFKCQDDGSQALVESVPVISGQGNANIELLTQAYSYDIILDGVLYKDFNGYTRCHVEALSSITLYVDLKEIVPTQQVIGLQGIVCSLEKAVANNTVTMTWEANPYVEGYVQGCIQARRLMITGDVVTYNNCTEEADGYSRTVTIPENSNDYIVSAYLVQNTDSLFCSDYVEYRPSSETSQVLGISSLLAAIFLITSLILIYGTEGAITLVAAAGGIIISTFLGLINFSAVTVSMYTAFLLLIALIGRYTRK